MILPLSVLLVFLVLAAQYESLTLPLAVLLIVPMGLLAAIFGLFLTPIFYVLLRTLVTKCTGDTHLKTHASAQAPVVEAKV